MIRDYAALMRLSSSLIPETCSLIPVLLGSRLASLLLQLFTDTGVNPLADYIALSLLNHRLSPSSGGALRPRSVYLAPVLPTFFFSFSSE